MRGGAVERGRYRLFSRRAGEPRRRFSGREDAGEASARARRRAASAPCLTRKRAPYLVVEVTVTSRLIVDSSTRVGETVSPL